MKKFNPLAWYLSRVMKLNDFDDERVKKLMTGEWDGKIENLPHIRGCQAFRGAHGVGAFDCDCGIKTLAVHQRGWFFQFLRCRSRAYAKYLKRHVHPVVHWKCLSDKERTLFQFFRVLAGDVAEGLRASRTLFWTESPSHAQERTAELRRLIREAQRVSTLNTK